MKQNTDANASTDHELDVPHFVAEQCGFDADNIPAVVEFDVDQDTDTNQLHRLMSNMGWRVMDTDMLNGVIYFVPRDN